MHVLTCIYSLVSNLTYTCTQSHVLNHLYSMTCTYSYVRTGLPLGKNAPIEGSLEPITAAEEPTPTAPEGTMDWASFDFNKDEKFNAANDPIAQEALDVDTFFKNLGSTNIDRYNIDGL